MQTCKYLSVICAATLLGGAISLRADETEAQAKAREALRQKMAELDAQGGKTKTVRPAPVVEPKPAPAPPPVVTPPPPPPPPSPVVVTPPPPPPPVEPPPVVQPPPVVVAPEPPVQPPPTPAPAVQRADSETIERTRTALRQKMSELNTAPSATGTPPVARSGAKSSPAVNPPPAAQNVVRVDVPPPQPIVPPPSPISATKEGRLAALLQQYRADTITPEQYHTQRAAILAEP